MSYRINTIYPAIQGEGCLTGIPMVLVRLQGCAVHCPWCDSKETWQNGGGRSLSVDELLVQVKTLSPGGWILLTGGEPAEQDLGPLIAKLQGEGYKVALETSGTADGCVGVPFDWVCVSPKTHTKVLPQVLAMADEIKMVICTQDELDYLDRLITHLQLKEGCEICLQPVSQSDKATELCIQVVQERQWRLSVQVHKYIDQP